jgi:hypothetical protein
MRINFDEVSAKQEIVDAFYKRHGPCCAGCDWWRWHNTLVGECIRAAPVSGTERLAMIGVTGSSLAIGAGHIMTRREHICGEFRDAGGQKAAIKSTDALLAETKK